MINVVRHYMYSIVLALHLQLSLTIGLGFSFLVGVFYVIVDDPRYSENLLPTFIGFILSLGAFIIGHYVHRHEKIHRKVDIKLAVQVVVNAWIIASLISAVVFFLSGFPDPNNADSYSFFRRFVDSFFESMSGFTTTGSSILINIEDLPRSVLMWRTLTHWIGGMGLVYMTITVINNFVYSRFNLINAEVESPEATEFKDEDEARNSGLDFLKIYGLLTIVMFIMMIISGAFFRTTPYEKWYDNAYDSMAHTFSTLGTGGFSHYAASAGLPEERNDKYFVSGGLQNPTSEWILTVFMIIGGSNFGIWYLLIFKKDWKSLKNNIEMRWYFLIILFIGGAITLILHFNQFYPYIADSARYAFFSVASVISTTGLANTDFSIWPMSALTLLFIVYFIGGTVGSTGGGLKVKRYLALFKFSKTETENFINNSHEFKPVTIDSSNFNRRDISLIAINVALYFIIFLLGSFFFLIFDSQVNDLTTAVNATIANLGNIGPGDFVTAVNNIGPTGNYSAYGEVSKLVLAGLMLFGRIGVLKLLIFILSFRKKELKV